jgi:hypothetical protein
MTINQSIRIGKFRLFLFFTNKIQRDYRSLQLRFFVGISHILPIWRKGFKCFRKNYKEYHFFEREN